MFYTVLRFIRINILRYTNKWICFNLHTLKLTITPKKKKKTNNKKHEAKWKENKGRGQNEKHYWTELYVCKFHKLNLNYVRQHFTNIPHPLSVVISIK